MDESGLQLTRWSVRAALLFFCLGASLRLVSRVRPQWQATARLAWTAGCVLFLWHVWCAFHYVHDWSHHAALQHTARETAELVGIVWGGGLYVNYVFTFIWVIDTIRWWVWPQRYGREPRWLRFAGAVLLIFVAFNATVVFERGPVRWFGLVGSLVLAVLWHQTRPPHAGH